MTMINNKKVILSSLLLLGFLFITLKTAYCKDIPSLLVFHSPSCHNCIQAKKELLPEIEKEFQGRIKIEYRDITDILNYTLMLGLRDKYNKSLELSIPVFYINGNILNAKGDLRNNLKAAIISSLEVVKKDEAHLGVDLVKKFQGFKPIAIAAAGFVDGINPCAFTVIVFFISYLALQGYRKRELLAIGLSFIFAVFLTYLLIGLGIFNFLYQLANFWLISRIFNLLIGLLSIILGILAIYDFWKFKKTQNADGLLLQLPRSIKNRIHSVIGLHYRKNKDSHSSGEERSAHFPKLILSAFVTGFLVSILEAVCTGQLYLPTISFIFKTTPFKLKAFLYLVIYNIMFVFPLIIIFVFSFLGVTSGQFARLMQKHILSIKILMAVFFLSLGIFLIWRG